MNAKRAEMFTRRDAAEAMLAATKASEHNRTESERPLKQIWHTGGWTWHCSPAQEALAALTLESYEARVARLGEIDAWKLAESLYRNDGATHDEIDEMERQCDLERELVLPLVDPAGDGTEVYRDQADALTVALFKRAADRTKPRKQKSPRRTHREVHEAMCGATRSATILGCPWCAKGKR